MLTIPKKGAESSSTMKGSLPDNEERRISVSWRCLADD